MKTYRDHRLVAREQRVEILVFQPMRVLGPPSVAWIDRAGPHPMARRYSASHVATRLDVILSVSLMPIKRFVSMAAGRTIDEFASASLQVLADICLRDADSFSDAWVAHVKWEQNKSMQRR